MLEFKELLLSWQILFDLEITIYAYILVSIKVGPYLYWGIPVHICLSEKINSVRPLLMRMLLEILRVFHLELDLDQYMNLSLVSRKLRN